MIGQVLENILHLPSYPLLSMSRCRGLRRLPNLITLARQRNSGFLGSSSYRHATHSITLRQLYPVRFISSDSTGTSPESPGLPQHDRSTVSVAAMGMGSTLTKSNKGIADEKARKASPAKAYADLAKAKLSGLVVATTAAGFVAAGGPLSTQLDVFTACVVGTALCSSSAAAWNQILEIPRDEKMKRTQQRPLITGALTLSQAKSAAVVWGASGAALLAAGTDPVTTTLGVGNIALYAGLYTYMKPRSIYNTWVGAVVGAIPPVMGWTAATGGSIMDMEALMLGGILYLWQMPHFFALSYMYREDYKRGGFQMVPCLEADGVQTANIVVRYAWYLSAVPFVCALTSVTSSMFALEGVALNAYALTVAHKFKRERTNANARKIFLTSLWYLPSLLMLFLLHSKTWDDEEEKTKDPIANFLFTQIHSIRDKGRDLCVHEQVVATHSDGKEACPVTVAAKQTRKGVQKVKSTADSATDAIQEKSTS